EKTYIFYKDQREFIEFKDHHSWLKPYALFKTLKEKYDHKNWSEWHRNVQNHSHHHLKELYEEEKEAMEFYNLIQFLAFSQMKEVKNYASRERVFLKGDIPILISPESLDVWLNREDFSLDFSAGAPPDMFSKEGQNWGFPLYRWDVVE